MKHYSQTKYRLGMFATTVLAAYAQSTDGIRSGVSVVPLYPADGTIRTDIQDQYVFLKGPNRYVISYSIALDPTSHAGSNGRNELPVTFPSQVSPAIDVRVQALDTGEYLYSYTAANGSDAQTSVAAILLRTRSIEAVEGLSSPVNSPGWTLARLRNPKDHLGPAWNAASPMQPGGATAQFSFRSTAKPGIAEVTFRGTPAAGTQIDRLPEPVRAQMRQLETSSLAGVRLITVGPAYAPDVNPFAVAADLFGQTARIADSGKNTAYVSELRGQLKQYLDNVGSRVQLLEDIKIWPDLRIKARPVSYEDGLLQQVLAATLGVK